MYVKSYTHPFVDILFRVFFFLDHDTTTLFGKGKGKAIRIVLAAQFWISVAPPPCFHYYYEYDTYILLLLLEGKTHTYH